MPSVGKGPRVGLLGGSFNPAHQGHRHISQMALKRLGLDAVWWLVSPQNPLKEAAGMAPLAERVATARRVAADSRIQVSDLESELGTRYTVDTVEALKNRFPDHRFVWVVGADILAEMHRWREWRRLFRSVAIAVLARPTYSSRALSSRAARRFARWQVSPARARQLADMAPPAWAYLRTPVHTASATRIREARAAVARAEVAQGANHTDTR